MGYSPQGCKESDTTEQLYLQPLAHSRPAINICSIELDYGVGGPRKMCHNSGISSEMHSFQTQAWRSRYFWMALHKCCVGFLSATKCHCVSLLVSFSCLGWGGLCNQSLGMSHCWLSCQTVHNCHDMVQSFFFFLSRLFVGGFV